jgi:hypothetical protein
MKKWFYNISFKIGNLLMVYSSQINVEKLYVET